MPLSGFLVLLAALGRPRRRLTPLCPHCHVVFSPCVCLSLWVPVLGSRPALPQDALVLTRLHLPTRYFRMRVYHRSLG